MPGEPETEELPDSGRHALVRQFRLRVRGTDPSAMFTSTEARVVIGTHPGAGFRVDDATASRFHCEIAIEDGRAVVRDLGSRNGTLVDGVAVLAAPLADHAVVTVGRTAIEFDLGAGFARIALSDRERFGGLVGRSHAMRAVFALLERAATSDATVLLHGETGTGKDLAATALHQASARAAGPLIVLDAGAVPPGLLESELFGHERGAFTGADRARPGCFELADGGTLFLDEVGELTLDGQAKLLRVLDTREVRRVGGVDVHRPDVRVIAATHRNLEAQVSAGRFRADLYYRLAVIAIGLPPLRARLVDLPLLIDETLARLGADPATAPRVRDPAFVARLAAHAWPGNVRELRNLIERCLAFAGPIDPVVDGTAPLPILDFDRSLGENRDRFVRYVERAYLSEFLRHHGDNVSAAARAAGLDRAHFHRLMVRCGLRPDTGER